MKKCLLSLLMLATVSINAQAMTQACPPTTAYRHVALGAYWEMANEYLNLGWTIAQTPAAVNYNSYTSMSNPLHVVLSNANDTNTFYMTCKSELMNNSIGLTVDANSYVAQADPSTNPNFKKINNNTYVCETTLNHPEACTSNIQQSARVVSDVTGGSING